MKKYLIYGTLGYFAYKLYSKAKTIYNSIKPSIIDARNLQIGLSTSTLDIDIALDNTSDTDINVNSFGLASIKRISLYAPSGTLIGHSSPGTTHIDIPAGGRQIIRNIPSEINNSYVLEALDNLSNIENVQLKIEIEAAGKTITI